MGGEVGRTDDLDQFQVAGMADFAVLYARRLVDTRPRHQRDPADALILEFDPALENIDDLKVAFMVMPPGDRLISGAAYDMGDDIAIGGVLDSQVLVFKERSQAAFKPGIFLVNDRKTLGQAPVFPSAIVRPFD